MIKDYTNSWKIQSLLA